MDKILLAICNGLSCFIICTILFQFMNERYKKSYSSLDNKISPKGYRILGKISKLTKKDIEKLVSNYGELSSIQEAPIEELSDTKLSKLKIKAIKNGLKRLKFTVELEK